MLRLKEFISPHFILIACLPVALSAGCASSGSSTDAAPGQGAGNSQDGIYANDQLSGTPSKGAGAGGGLSIGRENADPDESGFAGASGDQFEAVGTNPFTMVAHDPLSTFAADVDTASYSLFRSAVRDAGTLPAPASVRLEEFVNAFDYDYARPQADAEHPFRLHLEAAPQLVTRNTTLLRLGIAGKVVPPRDKEPANLVFLVDVSGSMQQELPLVRGVLQATVALLEPEDTISIVTYASNPSTPLQATKVENGDTIAAAIDRLVAGGSTNGEGGINAAYAQAESAFIEGGINQVVLCTDGDFNVGLSSNESLEELIVEKRKTGVNLTALAFGQGNVNDAMMERVSNAGNGIYGYIGNLDDAKSYVKNDMLQSLVHIAKDMKIQVEFNGDLVRAYRLLGYENRAIADVDFRNDVIDAGEIGSGHTVTALYELVLKDGELPALDGAPAPETGDDYEGESEIAADDLVLLKVRYKHPGASEEDAAMETSASLAASDVAFELTNSSADFRWTAAVASFAEILKQSPYAEPEALGVIEAVVAGAKADYVDREEFASLLQTAAGILQP